MQYAVLAWQIRRLNTHLHNTGPATDRLTWPVPATEIAHAPDREAPPHREHERGDPFRYPRHRIRAARAQATHPSMQCLRLHGFESLYRSKVHLCMWVGKMLHVASRPAHNKSTKPITASAAARTTVQFQHAGMRACVLGAPHLLP